MSSEILISIVTNESETVIGQCLNSLEAASQNHSFTTCILDNASQDNTCTIIKQNHPQVQLIESNVKRGFGANQNTILQNSLGKFDYVLILNDDVFLTNHCIDNLVKVLHSHAEIGAVCPSLYYPSGEPQVSGTSEGSIGQEVLRLFKIGKLVPTSLKGLLVRLPAPFKNLLGSSISGYLANYKSTERLRYVQYLSGACMLVKMKALSEVGFFDEAFHMYYEDTDWGRRANLQHWKLAVVADEKAVHHTQHSMGVFSLVESERSKFIYYKKYHHSAIGISCLALLTAMIYAIRFILCKLRGSSGNQKALSNAYLAVVKNSLGYI